VELTDDPVDERDLAGEVDVVGAVLHAGLDDGPSVERVGADQVQDHPGARRHLVQALLVAHVRADRRRSLGALLGQDGAQPFGVARRGRPGGAGLGGAVLEIAGHAASSDAGRAEDNDVELGLGHGGILWAERLRADRITPVKPAGGRALPA
jgi:hypothetical protein